MAKKTLKPAPRKAAAKTRKAQPDRTPARRAAAPSGKAAAPARRLPARGASVTFDKFFEWLELQTQKIKAQDLEGLMRRAGEIRLSARGPGAFGYYAGTGKRVFGYLRDYWKGSDRDVPWYSVAAAVGAALYMLSPVDLVPDFIPVLGTLDDAAVIAACLALIERDLAAHEARRGISSPQSASLRK